MAKQSEFIHQRQLRKKDFAQLSRAILNGIATQAQVQMVNAPETDRETAEAAYQQARKLMKKTMEETAKRLNLPPIK